MTSSFVRSTLSFVAVATLGLGFCSCASAQDDVGHDEDVFVFETGPDGSGHAPRVPFFDRMPAGLVSGGQGFGALAFSGPRARLGVMIEPTDDGLKVSEVQDDSLAAAAGVEVGDLIHRVGQRRIQSSADVALALRGQAAGSEVGITVIREGQGLVELTGILPEPPADQRVAAAGGALLGVDLDAQDGRVVVSGVVDQSGAWFAGVEKGDVLTSLDGQAMTTPEEVQEFVSAREPGEFVALGVERDGDMHEFRARLGTRTGRDRLLRFVSPGTLDGTTGMLLPQGMTWRQGVGPRTFSVPGHGAYALRLHGDDDLGMGEWNTWLHKLHEDGMLGDGGAHRTRIEVKDGVMTIERDGEVETYQLDELEDAPFPRLRHPPHPDGDGDGGGGGEDQDEDQDEDAEIHEAHWSTGPQDV